MSGDAPAALDLSVHLNPNLNLNMKKCCRYTQLFNVNGDAPAALDLSVHYPLLQMLTYFDWIKLEDVANATARPLPQLTPPTALGTTRMPADTKRCAPAACAALAWPGPCTTACIASQDAAASSPL